MNNLRKRVWVFIHTIIALFIEQWRLYEVVNTYFVVFLYGNYDKNIHINKYIVMLKFSNLQMFPAGYTTRITENNTIHISPCLLRKDISV